MSALHISANGGTASAPPSPFDAIPTNDPAAALRFCRQLQAMLSAQEVVDVTSTDSQHSAFTASPKPPTVSVVIPVFNEQANLPILHERLKAVLDSAEPGYELIFVDDGSRDLSSQLLRSMAASDTRVRVIELARNFGHQVAISAGLDYASGDAVIVMDADLQDPPEALPQFIAKWREGHDVVYAIRTQRKEGWLKRTAYSAFYRILQRAANVTIPLDSGDFCIMDREVVDLLVRMPERNRFVRGIRSWVGLNQVGLPYERQARYAGQPKYTLGKLVVLALDGLISFSVIPLRLIGFLGFAVSLISILLAVAYTIQKLTIGLSPPGFATIVVSIFFLAGIQLITIGVIGEYVGRIFEEVKRRPLYIVRRVIAPDR